MWVIGFASSSALFLIIFDGIWSIPAAAKGFNSLIIFSMEHAFAVVPREMFKESRPSQNRVTRVRARPERNENTRQTNAAATSMLRVRMLRNEVN